MNYNSDLQLDYENDDDYRVSTFNAYKVVLEGHGSDEQLGGYPYMIRAASIESLRKKNFKDYFERRKVFLTNPVKASILARKRCLHCKISKTVSMLPSPNNQCPLKENNLVYFF